MFFFYIKLVSRFILDIINLFYLERMSSHPLMNSCSIQLKENEFRIVSLNIQFLFVSAICFFIFNNDFSFDRNIFLSEVSKKKKRKNI